jgi:hypothetical protein
MNPPENAQQVFRQPTPFIMLSLGALFRELLTYVKSLAAGRSGRYRGSIALSERTCLEGTASDCNGKIRRNYERSYGMNKVAEQQKKS